MQRNVWLSSTNNFKSGKLFLFIRRIFTKIDFYQICFRFILYIWGRFYEKYWKKSPFLVPQKNDQCNLLSIHKLPGWHPWKITYYSNIIQDNLLSFKIMSRCIRYNIVKIKYLNQIYVFDSRTLYLSISFNFTFVSIHADLPYRHVFAATHCDIRLYCSVIFNWNLSQKNERKEQLKGRYKNDN